MNRRRDGKRRWGLCLRRVAAGSVALIILAFLLLQALLATSWLHAKVAGRLSERIGGLEVEIESLSWTPWNGARIGGLEVKQPAALRELVPTPLLVVDEIHAWPDYRAALRRQLSASEVTVLRPKLHVTVDMLMSIAAAGMPAAEPPAIAAVALRPGPGENPQPEGSPLVSEPRSAAGDPVRKPATTSLLTPEPETAARSETKVVRKRMRFVVEDGALELVRVGMREGLVRLEGVNLDLPLFGEAGESVGRVATIECLGQAIDEGLEIEVKTEGSVVRFLLPGDLKEDAGLMGSCHLGLVGGLPFQADMGLRLAKVERINVSKLLAGQCGEVQARIQGVGWLRALGSWRGLGAFEANKPIGWLGGQMLGFDSASAMVQLAGGAIQSPDFRVMGDSAAILGNGWITSQDGAAVVRLVVPNSVVDMINRELGTWVKDGVFRFKPLRPGNRCYSDVSIWRGETGWSAGFGDGGSVVPLDELLSANLKVK